MAAFADRELPDTLCLFDVDGTLTAARDVITPEMKAFMTKLRKKCVIALVGGSDLGKIDEQLQNTARSSYDFTFGENGLTAFRGEEALDTQSFLTFIGEERLQSLVNFVLKYIADLTIPQKRGTFVEFRNGMLNISPIGRNCSRAERNAFEEYDKEHNIRKTMVAALKAQFPDYGLTYSIGGQISFDVFPNGWDKTYCLGVLSKYAQFKTIHFFGDKTWEGGNDFEIFSHPSTVGHAVVSPEDTRKQLNELFGIE